MYSAIDEYEDNNLFEFDFNERIQSVHRIKDFSEINYYGLFAKNNDNIDLDEDKSISLTLEKVKEENPTELETNFDKENEFPYIEPIPYLEKDIMKIFNKEENKKNFQEIKEKLIFDKISFENETNLINKKRKCPDFEKNNLYILLNNEEENVTDNINRGIKTKLVIKKKHNQMTSDNVVKKVKGIIFKYPLFFLNNIINQNRKEEEKIKLLKLAYKYVNKLKREQDLKFLGMPLKNLFSKEISQKYASKRECKKYNKEVIDKIIKNEKDDTILFSLNMTFRNWLDIFTLKKSVKEVLSENTTFRDKKIDCEKIERNFVGLDKLFKKNYITKLSNEHLTRFIYYLYNYERWFFNKKGRNRKPKKKNN